MRDVELDPPRPRTAVDRRTTMFASTPSTCTRRTLDLPRKDWDIRYLRYLGNSDIAQKTGWTKPQRYPSMGIRSSEAGRGQVWISNSEFGR